MGTITLEPCPRCGQKSAVIGISWGYKTNRMRKGCCGNCGLNILGERHNGNVENPGEEIPELLARTEISAARRWNAWARQRRAAK